MKVRFYSFGFRRLQSVEPSATRQSDPSQAGESSDAQVRKLFRTLDRKNMRQTHPERKQALKFQT